MNLRVDGTKIGSSQFYTMYLTHVCSPCQSDERHPGARLTFTETCIHKHFRFIVSAGAAFNWNDYPITTMHIICSKITVGRNFTSSLPVIM